MLLKDLGLRSDRKRFEAERKGNTGVLGLSGWWREWFSPYKALDYQGAVNTWPGFQHESSLVVGEHEQVNQSLKHIQQCELHVLLTHSRAVSVSRLRGG
ncbi:hypothetical protein BJX99DRAFT_231171 [Aspergillus californicus]